jgi:glycerol kinase
MKYILSIDQGTTGTKACLVDQSGRIADLAYREFTQIYPQPGWVEHDPLEIWQTVIDTIDAVVGRHPGKILALGLTNQRETTVIWVRTTPNRL